MDDIATVKSRFSCEDAAAKRADVEYKKLSAFDRTEVDVIYQKCIRATGTEEPGEVPVAMVNPKPFNENDRIFYGTISRKQLIQAQKACATGGAAAGLAFTVQGQSAIGSALYNYSNVGCASIADSLSSNNLYTLIGPSQIVKAAIAQKMTEDILKAVPLVSKGDKKKLEKLVGSALKPPIVNINKKNIEFETGPAKLNFKKPKVVIKTPKIDLPDLPDFPKL